MSVAAFMLMYYAVLEFYAEIDRLDGPINTTTLSSDSSSSSSSPEPHLLPLAGLHALSQPTSSARTCRSMHTSHALFGGKYITQKTRGGDTAGHEREAAIGQNCDDDIILLYATQVEYLFH